MTPAEQEPQTSLARFVASTGAALVLLAVGLELTFAMAVAPDSRARVPTFAPASVAPPAADDPSATEALLRARAEAYQGALASGDEARIGTFFLPDAWIRYDLDFGGAFERETGAYRVNETSPVDPAWFDGYEVLSTAHRIEAVVPDDEGGAVHLVVTERYRWDGWVGTRTARERLTFVAYEGQLYVAELQVSETYR